MRIWDVNSGVLLVTLRHEDGHAYVGVGARWSADESRILSWGTDNTVRVWDATSGAELLILRGHKGYVWAAGFSSDGARIVSGAADNSVRVTWIGRGKQELIATARERLPRQLTEEERRRFYLTTD